MNGLRAFLAQNAPWLSAGVLLTFLSSFGQTFFIALFAADVQDAFALSHGGWGGIYALGTTASAIVMVWAGQLADRLRIRTLGILSLAALALACVAMAVNPWLWALPVVIFALRLTGQGMMGHIAAVAMARWFVATRGRALSIAALGFSVGHAVLPIAVVAFVGTLGWRNIWLLCAGVALAGIPLLLWLLRRERTPASLAQSDSALGMRARHWTRAEVLKHPLFWLMIPALMGPGAFNTAFFFHQVHYAEIKEITNMQMVSYFPFYTLVTIAAMMVSGMLLDWLGAHCLAPLHQLPMVAAFIAFALAAAGPGFTIGFLCLALTTGASATIIPAFWAEFYGTAHLGAIKALGAAIMVLGSALGPGLTGLLIDLGVGIETQYIGIATYFALATLMMWIGITRARASL